MKINANYTPEDYLVFNAKVAGQAMVIANAAILYGANAKTKYAVTDDKKHDSSDLQNAIEKLYTILLHEADYIFTKEDDNNA